MQENKQEKSLIKQNILLYLEKKGVTSYEFYKKSGVTRGVLQQNNGISEDNMTRFLAYAPDVNPAWLLTGEGPMINEDPPGDVATASDTQETVSPLNNLNGRLTNSKSDTLESGRHLDETCRHLDQIDKLISENAAYRLMLERAQADQTELARKYADLLGRIVSLMEDREGEK